MEIIPVPDKIESERPRPTILYYFVRPQVFLFLLTLFNFVWYFSGSGTVHHFGSTKITFCVVCPWYWDWSITNPPTLLLFAGFCTLFRDWRGYLLALIASGYVLIEGIIWVSRGVGFLQGIQQRAEVILDNDVLPFWEAPDGQYLIALLFAATSSAFLIREVGRVRELS